MIFPPPGTIHAPEQAGPLPACSDEWLTFSQHTQRTAYSEILRCAQNDNKRGAARPAPLTPTLSREGRGRRMRAAAHTYLLALAAEEHPQAAEAQKRQSRRLWNDGQRFG